MWTMMDRVRRNCVNDEGGLTALAHMADNPLVRPVSHDSDCLEPCTAKGHSN